MHAEPIITIEGFLNDFLDQHIQRPERGFCFVLGAGASKPSRIPTGQELAARWLRDLHQRSDLDGLSLDRWAQANLAIDGFDLTRAGEFYPQLYTRRFEGCEQAGYAFLEHQMDGRQPSYGYSILAYLLSVTHHKIVVTTNFDNLVADALAIHAGRSPIVVSHDALVAYVRADLRRPLIAKVHGGLGFSPKSKQEELGPLSKDWMDALTQVFTRCTPIVIGYEGNDGSLMRCLEGLPQGIPDRVYWCLYTPDGNARRRVAEVSGRIKNFVNARGCFVPVPSFDALMQLMFAHMAKDIPLPNLLEHMKESARKREDAYDEQQRNTHKEIQALGKASSAGIRGARNVDTSSDSDATLLTEAAEELAQSRDEKPWWAWIAEAEAVEPGKRAEIYKKALAALPHSGELIENYIRFLELQAPSSDKAWWAWQDEVDAADPSQQDAIYQRAIRALPHSPELLGNYAIFLTEENHDPDAAEAIHKRAIEADPNHALNLGNYASFLAEQRGNFDVAEMMYKRAIEADPSHAPNLAEYAEFLAKHRQNLEMAEVVYKRALDADPSHAPTLVRYADFLAHQRSDRRNARTMYDRALEAMVLAIRIRRAMYEHERETAPNDAGGNQAQLLVEWRTHLADAEALYARVLEQEPRHALGNYADFLTDQHNLLDALDSQTRDSSRAPRPSQVYARPSGASRVTQPRSKRAATTSPRRTRVP